MKRLSPDYPFNSTPSTSDEQKLINRDTIQLPPDSDSRPTAAVGQDDEPSAGDRGDASAGTDALSPALPPVPAPPAIHSSTSTSNVLLSPSLHSSSSRQHSNTQQHSSAAQSERPSPIQQGSGIQTAEQALGECQEEPTSTSREAGATMTEVKEGDKVAWNWGSGAPGGVASEVVTDGEAKMVSHRGNEVKKQGSPDNPAVHIERSGNDVVKKASELEVEEEGPKHGSGGGEKKDEGEKKDGEGENKDGEGEKKENGEAKTGEKRSADEANKDDDGAAEKKDEKKDADKANGQPPKKKGRPVKEGGAKKETKQKKAPKPAATADGKPRRSGRNKS